MPIILPTISTISSIPVHPSKHLLQIMDHNLCDYYQRECFLIRQSLWVNIVQWTCPPLSRGFIGIPLRSHSGDYHRPQIPIGLSTSFQTHSWVCGQEEAMRTASSSAVPGPAPPCRHNGGGGVSSVCLPGRNGIAYEYLMEPPSW